MIWWNGVLISSYAHTQSTIATSSAESEYYGACAVASEAVYVKELLKFIGEDVHIHLELDASSAMGSRVGLGKARHVAMRHLWLQHLVADKTIRLVKVKGTHHPPDVGTKHLSKQGMLHAKRMLGLMEPEALAPYGYEVTYSSGVRDKLDKSANLVATIGALSVSDREISGIAVSLMFVLAAGYAPVRAAASQEMKVVTFMDYRQLNDGDVVW
eukprot:5768643-Amphidinium_carterae.1